MSYVTIRVIIVRFSCVMIRRIVRVTVSGFFVLYIYIKSFRLLVLDGVIVI